jgi:hypothetical protein
MQLQLPPAVERESSIVAFFGQLPAEVLYTIADELAQVVSTSPGSDDQLHEKEDTDPEASVLVVRARAAFEARLRPATEDQYEEDESQLSGAGEDQNGVPGVPV